MHCGVNDTVSPPSSCGAYIVEYTTDLYLTVTKHIPPLSRMWRVTVVKRYTSQLASPLVNVYLFERGLGLSRSRPEIMCFLLTLWLRSTQAEH